MAITKKGYESDDSIEEQIRSAAEERSAGKNTPNIEANEEIMSKMPVRPGQEFSGKKTPIVTKEQLAASGLSLRDYLNKQQGLTRRGGSNAPARQESSLSSNEGRNKPSPSNPLMDNDRDNVSSMPVNERIKKSLASAREGSGPTDSRSANQRIKEALGMKKGGAVKKMASGGSVSSASRRADGIATKGKTRGRMC